MADVALLAVAAAASVAGAASSAQAAQKQAKVANRQADEVAANADRAAAEQAAINARTVKDTETQAQEVSTYAEQDRIAAQSAGNRDAALQLKQYEEERKAATLEADQQMALQQRAVVSALSSIAVLRGANGLDPYSMTGKALMDFSLAEGAADLDTLKANWGRQDKRLDLAEQAAVDGAANIRSEADRNARNTTTQARNTVTAAKNNQTQSNFQAFQGAINTSLTARQNAINVGQQASAAKTQALVSGVRGLSQAGMQGYNLSAKYNYFSGA